MTDLFNHAAKAAVEAGKIARDAGIALVTDNNLPWMARAFASFETLAYREFTGEDIRLHVLAAGIEKPKKPHAWGALTRHLIRAGLIERTGKDMPMTQERSHARRTPVYRRPSVSLPAGPKPPAAMPESPFDAPSYGSALEIAFAAMALTPDVRYRVRANPTMRGWLAWPHTPARVTMRMYEMADVTQASHPELYDANGYATVPVRWPLANVVLL